MTSSLAAENFWTGTFLGLLIIAVVGAAIVGVSGWAVKRWIAPVLDAWWKERRIRRYAPFDNKQLAAYLTHLRDFVMPMIWRAQQEPASVRSYVRRDVLEPIRAYVPTVPGEQLKIVWFRPNETGNALVMHEQVGHTPEGQHALSLPIGSGSAGRAFVEKETVYEPDIETSEIFQRVPTGARRGSIACVPIRRGESAVTGVLSVLSTSANAFRYPEMLYFEALASAIGAVEIIEPS